MEAIDRLYKRDKIIKRSINIDQELYSQLQYLSDKVYDSICLRKEFFDKLMKISEQTGIPFTRIVNGVIKQFLEEYKDEFNKK